MFNQCIPFSNVYLSRKGGSKIGANNHFHCKIRTLLLSFYFLFCISEIVMRIISCWLSLFIKGSFLKDHFYIESASSSSDLEPVSFVAYLLLLAQAPVMAYLWALVLHAYFSYTNKGDWHDTMRVIAGRGLSF